MANIGSNPTVNGDTSRLEVFIFDFSGDIYGEWIFVELLQKIRSEVKFAGLDELREQLAKDRKTAEKLLAPQLSPTSDNI
jgi:riboflavin kinase/FMN adenylyltransferase